MSVMYAGVIDLWQATAPEWAFMLALVAACTDRQYMRFYNIRVI
jgi:hypothetical protein